MVVAVATNGVIGRAEELPWKLRSDLQRFKRMTMGHCLLMGRKTYVSIGRPLPGRQTMVLSRSVSQAEQELGNAAITEHSGITFVSNLSDVERYLERGRKVMVVGGAQVYRATIDYCSTIWLTRVLTPVDGDTWFPEMDWDLWQLESSEPVSASEYDQWATEFQIWKRRLP